MNEAVLINVDGSASVVQSVLNFGTFGIDSGDLVGATGWKLLPEGLCKGSICIPVRNLQELTDGKSLDLAEFARLMKLNILIDAQRKIAALGEQAENRSASMSTLDAPDFTLPDIHGRQVSFSDYNRRKRLLLAWSSW